MIARCCARVARPAAEAPLGRAPPDAAPVVNVGAPVALGPRICRGTPRIRESVALCSQAIPYFAIPMRFQLTRARITQLMNLTLLAPDIQEQVLFLEAVDGREPMSERDLRTVIYAGDWGAQRVQWSDRISRPIRLSEQLQRVSE